MKTKSEYQLQIAHDIINHLPPEDLNELKTMIKRILNKANSTADNEWESFLMNGPVMSDKRYREFKKNRKNFNG